MTLDALIQPEILNDEFHQFILALAASQPLHHILEIGSSSGQGSTDAWAKGIAQNPLKPTLHCIELSKVRFQALQSYYQGNPQVRCYWASSVGIEQFPTPEMVTEFYNTHPSRLRQYPLDVLLGWLQQDIQYVTDNQAPPDGIAQALRATGQTAFDAVLIDGSEFTGVPEFIATYGAKFILLDDIMTYKNWEVLHLLLEDTRYQLIRSQTELRHGYAVFVRKD